MFLIILLIDFIFVFVASKPTAVVNTTTGLVQGQILKTVVNSVKYAAFTGIRFGKAPVGYLRFKVQLRSGNLSLEISTPNVKCLQPPVPVDPWTEIFNATSPGNECPQIDAVTNKFEGSEDCLFLSVYTPVTNLEKPPTTLKSVMVWIYGGDFLRGSQSDPRHHPDYILERDVVYVPINYRLGALGFLCLNHPNATGNAGLKDQVLALKWIQANIEKFGGDPKNVTIFGQSAGAVSVGFHVLSEASAGLFDGAISMSGTPLVPWGFTLPSIAQNRAVLLGSLLGNFTTDKNRLLKTLYAASPEELVQNVQKINPVTPFTPTLEDPTIATDLFISECSVRKYVTGNFTKVPQILGYMEQETVTFLSYLDIFSDTVDRAIYIFPSTILSLVKTGSDSASELSSMVVEDDLIEAAVNDTTNIIFKAQIDTTQRFLAAKNDDKPIYYYHITFTTNKSLHNIDEGSKIEGAGHSDDLAYIFYVPYANYSHNLSDPTALTIYRVTTMWTNFAKYGNPTPDWIDEYPLGITWPESGCSGKALNIGYNLTVGSRPIGLSTEVIETANYPILGAQNGCPFSIKMPTCNNNNVLLL